MAHVLTFSVIFLMTFLKSAWADVDCQLVTQGAKQSEQQIGIIFVPGGTIPGEAYGPQLRAILEAYDGSAWGGLTIGWKDELPNPLDMGDAIQACLDKVFNIIVYDIQEGHIRLSIIRLEATVS